MPPQPSGEDARDWPPPSPSLTEHQPAPEERSAQAQRVLTGLLGILSGLVLVTCGIGGFLTGDWRWVIVAAVAWLGLAFMAAGAVTIRYGNRPKGGRRG